MSVDPRMEAVAGRFARLADLLDALAAEATTKRLNGGLGAGALVIAAEYAAESYNALNTLLDEGRRKA